MIATERETSKDDEDVAVSYLGYLKDQFKELDDRNIPLSNDAKNKIGNKDTYTSKKEEQIYGVMQQVMEKPPVSAAESKAIADAETDSLIYYINVPFLNEHEIKVNK